MFEEAVMGGRGVQPGLGQWVGVEGTWEIQELLTAFYRWNPR